MDLGSYDSHVGRMIKAEYYAKCDKSLSRKDLRSAQCHLDI